MSPERRPWVKVCGITTATDALFAHNAGADALGLIFVPNTPRTVGATNLQTLADACKYKVPLIGVFANQPPELINELATLLPLHAVQLHGDETPEDCAAIVRPVIKVFSLAQPPTPEELAPYLPHIDKVLLDWPKNRKGEPVDWSALPCPLPAEAFGGKPVILAGGLTPETVAEVIATYRPYGVDVASGVESRVGVKDCAKVTAFIQAAKGV